MLGQVDFAWWVFVQANSFGIAPYDELAFFVASKTIPST